MPHAKSLICPNPECRAPIELSATILYRKVTNTPNGNDLVAYGCARCGVLLGVTADPPQPKR